MNCNCAICQNNLPFTMPDEIISAARQGNLVLFCGAGISTEKKGVMPYSFYTSIREELGVEDTNISFSELMQMYCKQPNGRKKMLRKIKDRFDYIHSFPELENNATDFHNELAELFFIKTIITTNWDTYFEDCCAATPITIPEDFAFWDTEDRYVLKIHGSINNLSTIVATKDDYGKCFSRLQNGIIGATLKTILATKTVVFIGFSFGDEDFSQILEYLRNEMNDIYPHIYIVTIDATLDKKLGYNNSTCIVTDGTYFLHQLKLIFKENGWITNCENRPIIQELLYSLKDIHSDVGKIDLNKYPNVIYTLAYQDGVIHALDRFLHMYSSGTYNIPGRIPCSARAYEKLSNDAHEAGDYWNMAYYEGYTNGLVLIEATEDNFEAANSFPLFFIPYVEQEIDCFDTFITELKKSCNKENEFSSYAQKIASRYGAPDMVVHHLPY